LDILIDLGFAFNGNEEIELPADIVFNEIVFNKLDVLMAIINAKAVDMGLQWKSVTK